MPYKNNKNHCHLSLNWNIHLIIELIGILPSNFSQFRMLRLQPTGILINCTKKFLVAHPFPIIYKNINFNQGSDITLKLFEKLSIEIGMCTICLSDGDSCCNMNPVVKIELPVIAHIYSISCKSMFVY